EPCYFLAGRLGQDLDSSAEIAPHRITVLMPNLIVLVIMTGNFMAIIGDPPDEVWIIARHLPGGKKRYSLPLQRRSRKTLDQHVCVPKGVRRAPGAHNPQAPLEVVGEILEVDRKIAWWL